MRIIDAIPGSKIYVGHQLDNEATVIRFFVDPILDLYSDDGTFSVYVRRYGETDGYAVGSPYVTLTDGFVYWTLTSADVAIAGDNECQVRYVIDETAVMSMKYIYDVNESIVLGDTVPEPMEEWADAIVEAISQVTPMPEDMVQVPLVNSMSRVLGIKDGEVVQTGEDITITGGLTAGYARINSVACKVFSGLPSWTGSSVSAPTGYSGYGRCFMYGLGEADKYFFLIDSASAMWVGRAVNNATSITWRPINYIQTADNWTENGITYKAWRCGDIVELSALGGTLTSNVAAESFLTTVPERYRPTTYSVEGWETSAGHRILVNTNGKIGCLSAYSSGVPIRFTVTYIGQQ